MKFENKTDLGTDECIVKYKSVFKEYYNGNYYWVSSEPVEEQIRCYSFFEPRTFWYTNGKFSKWGGYQ